jgi:hypothetical protein
MSEKKLRLVLTSFTVAASLFLTTAAGNAAERPRRQTEGLRVLSLVEGGWRLPLWRLLSRAWQKAGSHMDPEGAAQKAGSHMDPEGATQKAGSHMDPEG